jgi:ATP-dependent DNA helicase RecQ
LPLDPAKFLSTCVSIDLEVDPRSARLFAFAAVRGEKVVVHKGIALEPALDRLEALCDGATHLVGHNILRHDLPHLVANRARLAGLGAEAIDTLWRQTHHVLHHHATHGVAQEVKALDA